MFSGKIHDMTFLDVKSKIIYPVIKSVKVRLKEEAVRKRIYFEV